MAAPSREATAALSLPQGAVRKTNYTSHVQHLHSLDRWTAVSQGLLEQIHSSLTEGAGGLTSGVVISSLVTLTVVVGLQLLMWRGNFCTICSNYFEKKKTIHYVGTLNTWITSRKILCCPNNIYYKNLTIYHIYKRVWFNVHTLSVYKRKRFKHNLKYIITNYINDI